MTARQVHNKSAISLSYEVRFLCISTCWKDNFNIFPMDPTPQSFLFCTSCSCQIKCRAVLSPSLFHVMVESRLRLRLACMPYSPGPTPFNLAVAEFAIFWLWSLALWVEEVIYQGLKRQGVLIRFVTWPQVFFVYWISYIALGERDVLLQLYYPN